MHTDKPWPERDALTLVVHFRRDDINDVGRRVAIINAAFRQFAGQGWTVAESFDQEDRQRGQANECNGEQTADDGESEEETGSGIF